MQQLPDGSLLVATSRPVAGGGYFGASGELVRLTDATNRGVADGPPTMLYSGLPGPATAVAQAGTLLLALTDVGTTSTVTVLRAGPTPASPLSRVGSFALTFPSGWEHHSYGLAVEPTAGQPGSFDVYFNVGSTANDAESSDPVALSVDRLTGVSSTTIAGASVYPVTLTDAGSSVQVANLVQIASGLRNATGIAIQPSTGDLYVSDNGIDGLNDPEEPLSADELDRIPAAQTGMTVPDFGFPSSYTQYRTGAQVGSGGIPPFAAFEPLPAPSTNESEGTTQIAFAPPAFPAAQRDGVFVGFHGRFALGGLANEENPVGFYDPATAKYFHFISNDEPCVGHLDGVLATQQALFLADMSWTGGLNGADAGRGVIYEVAAVP